MVQDLSTIGISMETSRLKAGLSDLDSVQKSANKAADAADRMGVVSAKAAPKVYDFANKSSSAFDRLNRSVNNTGGAFDRLQRLAVGGFVGGALLTGIISSIDSYTKYTAQLKLATSGQDAYNNALKTTKEIARAAQSDIGIIGTLYARISRNTEQLGFSQQKVGQITESVALALKANGATVNESSSAILQLSQAFGAGVLRGEEFNAVNEAAPNLIKAIADSLGRPIGEMRKLAEEGKLTSDILGIALPEALEQFRKEAAQVQTIGGAFVNLRTSVAQLFGEVANNTGVITSLAGAINGLSEIVASSGPAITGLLTGLAAASVVAGMAALASNIGLVASAVRGLAIAMLLLSANPVALAILGIGAAVGGFAYLDAKRKKIEENTSAIQKLSEKSRQLAEVEAQLSQVRNSDGSIKAGANRLVVRDLLQQELRIKKEMAALEESRAAKAPNEAAQKKLADNEAFAALTAQLDLEDQVAKELERIAKLEKERGAAAASAAKQALQRKLDFIETLRTEQTQLEASIATQGKLSEYDKDRIKAMQIFGEQLPHQVENQLLINKTLREEAELREQIAKDEAKAIADGEKRIDDIIEQAQQIERQNRVYGLGKDAVEELIIAELERKKVGASPEIVAQLEREIEARQRLAGALNQEESFKAAEKAAKEAEREFDRVTDEIGKNLAEALLSGGKDGTKKLGEYMKRYFLQLVIRTQIEPIIKQAAGGILGGGSGQGFSMQGLAGALGSLSTFSTGGAFGTALSQGLESLALNPALLEKIGNGIFFNSSSDILSGLGRDLATSATSISSFAGQIAPYAGSIAAVLQGDIKGGLGSAAGTYIGGAIAGPIGAAIGSYLGGMLGGGGKISATALPGSVGANIAAQIEAQYMATVKALGGRAADASFAAGGNTGRQGQNPNFTAYASVGGRQVYNSGQSFGGDGLFLRGEIALNEQNVAAQALRATIAALKETNFAANVNAFFDTVNAAGASIEQLGKALETAQLLTFVNKEFRSLGGALATLADASVETIGQFFAVTGGMENLSNGITAFFDAFYTEQEKSARLLNQVTNAFAELGKPLPSTRQELRALVDGLDLRNAADQQIYATILQLTPALNALLPAFDGVGDSVEGLLQKITNSVTEAIDKQIDLSKRAADQARDAAKSYRELSESLLKIGRGLLSAVSGTQQANLRQQFNDTFRLAMQGDRTALGALGGQATSLVDSLGTTAGSRVELAGQTALINLQLQQASEVARVLGIQNDYQAQLFDIQTAALDVLREQLQSGNVTEEILRKHSELLGSIGAEITRSGSLTVGQLLEVEAAQLQTVGVSDLIAQFTGGSEDLLNAVLGRLNAQETGTVDIVSQLQRGNIEIGNYLTQLIAAVKQQSEAAAAELKRKQDLESAQSKLAEIAKNREGAISGVSKSSQDIFGLAAKYGVFLNADQGAPLLQNTAKFGVNSQGLFDAIFNQISTSGGDPAGFKREFYATGGLYSQTYGRSGELGNYLTEIKAQRDLVRSLGGVPQFANGGMFGGGMRIVGERGPELEATGPARYWNAAQTRMMMSSGGGNADLVMEMRATRLEIFRFREESAQYDYAIAKNTMSMDRRLERWDDGDRCRTFVDQEAGETVNVTVVA